MGEEEEEEEEGYPSTSNGITAAKSPLFNRKDENRVFALLVKRG